MVTNINLVSPEGERRNNFSGRLSLILSLVLLVLVGGAYLFIRVMASNYNQKQTELSQEILLEKEKIAGPEYEALADFQQRINFLDKIIDDHIVFDFYLRSLSKYVLPEVRLSNFGWSYEGDTVNMAGTAPNFDVLSKELILLRNCPFVQSLSFKNANETLGTESSPGGVSFSLTLALNKNMLKK